MHVENQERFESKVNLITMEKEWSSLDIPGILLLSSQKVYGTICNQNKHKQKYLYKFVPYNSSFPHFLVPYSIQNSFSKIHKNQYMIIRFKEWFQPNNNTIRPLGKIVHKLGDVDKNENIYEYLLYCRGLKHSNKSFQELTKTKCRIKTEQEWTDYIMKHYKVEDRTNEEVYSIDPDGSKDIDDAFSIDILDENYIRMSVYIANVPIWLDAMELWTVLSKRTSTIYLPNNNNNMLPNILSDNMCSLLQGKLRFAFAMDITFKRGNDKSYEIQRVTYHSVCIRLRKNVAYEDTVFMKSKTYTHILDIITYQNNTTKYVKNGIHNSHDVVMYLMIFMNCEIAKWCHNNKIGIYRVLPQSSNSTSSNIDNIPDKCREICYFLEVWNNIGAKYATIPSGESQYEKHLVHSQIGTDCYVHATSPIRRIVDLINLMIIQERMGFFNTTYKNHRNDVYLHWTSKNGIDYINTQHKQIRHVQNEAELIHMVTSNPNLLDNIVDGYVVQIERISAQNNDVYTLIYTIYIPSLRIVKKMKVSNEYHIELDLYSRHTFKLYLYQDEDNVKRKLCIVNTI